MKKKNFRAYFSEKKKLGGSGFEEERQKNNRGDIKDNLSICIVV